MIKKSLATLSATGRLSSRFGAVRYCPKLFRESMRLIIGRISFCKTNIHMRLQIYTGIREEIPERAAPQNRVYPKTGQRNDMLRISEPPKRSLTDDDYAKAYSELETGFELARQVIEARVRAGLTQEELAARIQTSRTVIVRLESGRVLPSMRTLERLAAATSSRLNISLEPLAAR